MADGGSPKRARHVEAALVGRAWSRATVETADGGLRGGLQPHLRLAGLRRVPDARRSELASPLLDTTGIESVRRPAPTMADTDWRADFNGGPSGLGSNAVPHELGHKHVTGLAGSTSTTCPSRPGASTLSLGLATIARGDVVSSISAQCVRRRAWSASSPRPTSPAPTTGGHRRRPDVRCGVDQLRPAAFAVVARATLCARPRGWRKPSTASRHRASPVAHARAAGGAGRAAPSAAMWRWPPPPPRFACRDRLSRGPGVLHLAGIALAIPGEDGEVAIHSATQHPADRAGGDGADPRPAGPCGPGPLPEDGWRFGGKETQATAVRSVAGLGGS